MPPSLDEFDAAPPAENFVASAPFVGLPAQQQHVESVPPPETEAANSQASTAGARRLTATPGSTSRLLVLATILVAVALLVVVGLILMETDLFDAEPAVITAAPAEMPVEVVRPEASRAKFEDVRPDVYSAYRKSIESTVKALGRRPDDVGLKAKLVTAFVLYLAHYPEDEQYAKEVGRYAQDLEGASGLDAQLARGAHAAFSGQTVTLYRELSPLTGKREYAYMSNLLMGLSCTFALRMEGDLSPIPAPAPVAPVDGAVDAGIAGTDAMPNEKVDEELAANPEPANDKSDGSDAPVEEDSEGGMDFVQEVMVEDRLAEEKEWREFAIKHLEAARKTDPTAPAPPLATAFRGQSWNDQELQLVHQDGTYRVARGSSPAVAAQVEHPDPETALRQTVLAGSCLISSSL